MASDCHRDHGDKAINEESRFPKRHKAKAVEVGVCSIIPRFLPGGI